MLAACHKHEQQSMLCLAGKRRRPGEAQGVPHLCGHGAPQDVAGWEVVNVVQAPGAPEPPLPVARLHRRQNKAGF